MAKRLSVTAQPTCRHCGQVIGVYEPAVVVAGGRVRETSRAADAALVARSELHYHRDCFLARNAA